MNPIKDDLKLYRKGVEMFTKHKKQMEADNLYVPFMDHMIELCEGVVKTLENAEAALVRGRIETLEQIREYAKGEFIHEGIDLEHFIDAKIQELKQ